ncbi:heparinase II/III domain-containing protein [Ochrovirga pacifica]|uniref:heparinase II/III domain-containing protein n=1 Tax=Ochrovirga pacifica TaxID=1042376 RepID=UPI0002557797|nr:heparinase II/III family protein [Ochrovirga pacifica]
MKTIRNKLVFCFAFCSIVSIHIFAQEHPMLMVTKAGVQKIRQELGKVPLFDASIKNVKIEVDQAIAAGIDVPVPKDYSGGYTHETHKRNFLIMQKAGLLYQILQDQSYAVYVRDLLFAYEKLYKTLPLHPQTRSYARGKLFWQCLNDSNWLVYTSQAYDCIYDWLSYKERKLLEKNLFRPFADFISVENPQFFNRVHNHSTWGNAAVGMIGLVMQDDELVKRALYGIENANLAKGVKDNDGGFISNENQKAGFIANIDEPFSPEGYYTEGPYYQRYAMYPFLAFAQALQNAKPELRIFKYKNEVLLNSVSVLLNLTDANGEFFPLNDGQKGMSYHSRELHTAVDLAYYYGDKNPSLLSIAKKQGRVLLNDAGLAVAMAVRDGKTIPFVKKTIHLTDGAKGNQGGISVIRYGEDEALTSVFKYAAQGLSHGHYDKLSFSLYNAQGDEVLQDYGLARFVNIEQKGGGNYLKENKTWAKQTIAHNTLVQDEVSHFNGKYEIGSKHHSELYFLDTEKASFQLVSAKETNAYPKTTLQRTQVMIKLEALKDPVLLDLLRVSSDTVHQYDLPFYYLGQLIATNFTTKCSSTLVTLSKKHGYQHLWLEGSGLANSTLSQFTFLNHQKYYTISTATTADDQVLLTRIGANDPKFNLRRDAGYMLRRNAKNTLFATVVEPHGGYSYVSEFSTGAKSSLHNIDILWNSESYTLVKLILTNGQEYVLCLANNQNKPTAEHTLQVGEQLFSWKGTYKFLTIK